MAHFGAALLAGWWLDRDAGLSPGTSEAMGRQADSLIAKHSWLFSSNLTFRSTGGGDQILEALSGGLDHTWAIGHDVIYAALALRTLVERPDLAAGWVADGVVAVLDSCHSQPLEVIGGVFDVRGVDAHEVDEHEVATSVSLAEVALRTILEFDHVYVGLHQGDIGHLADHAQALIMLERLGYQEAARSGLRGFREHLAVLRRVCHLSADLPEVHEGLHADPHEAAYWDQASPSNDWAVGHVFKYPYAMLDLLNVAGNPTLAAPVLSRLGELVVE